MTYLRKTIADPVPQSEPLPGREREQVVNSAGGYVFPVDDWTRLDRFLVLGTEGGSYYAGQRELTLDSVAAVKRCIRADGKRTVSQIIAISEAGRAVRNRESLFALAACLSYGSKTTRQLAGKALPMVARTGSHLLEFARYATTMRGWGRTLRTAVANWYLRDVSEVAFQCVKYGSRYKWSHKDLVLLSHPRARSPEHHALFRWVRSGAAPSPELHATLSPVVALSRIQACVQDTEALQVMDQYPFLSWEMIPSELRTDAVWEALLPRIPLGALIRLLPMLTRRGLLPSMADGEQTVVRRLSQQDQLERARIHPMGILKALKTYSTGRSDRGQSAWTPNPRVVAALEQAFDLAFGLLDPIRQRVYLGLDVSGSMGWASVAGMANMSAREAGAAMAMLVARKCPRHVVRTFSAGDGSAWGPPIMRELDIRPEMSLQAIIQATSDLPFGGTDCAMPMLDAMAHRIKADAFLVITDSESWAGKVHAAEALRQYRRKMGIPARLVVVAMTANRFSVADPRDGGMLDVVGFDTSGPAVIRRFIAGEGETENLVAA